MNIRLWSPVFIALGLLVTLTAVGSEELTEKEWQECVSKTDVSDESLRGVMVVEEKIKDECGDKPVKQAHSDRAEGVHSRDM